MIDSLLRMGIALFENEISSTFTIIIGIYFLYGLIWFNAKNEKARFIARHAASAMTSLGILGTFLGIFIGLLDFDIRTINRSVPTLLEGLKVAFGTSILGLAGAVAFKVIGPIIQSKEISDDDEATAEDLLQQLKEINKGITENNTKQREQMIDLKNALVGSEESSVVGQIKMLRTDTSDLSKAVSKGFKEQVAEFKEFSEKMSEAFSKAIIDELKSVIREFNEKISEQFGENFKQLNEAVGKLVQWQENYKEQMVQLETTLSTTIDSIKTTETSISSIAVSSKQIPEQVEKMAIANDHVNEQLERLTSALGGFAEMRNKALDAFPVIERNISNLTENLNDAAEKQKQSVSNISETWEDIMHSQKETAQFLEESFTHLRNTSEETSNILREGIEKSSEQLVENLKTSSEMVTDSIEAIHKQMLNAVETSTKEINGSLNETMSHMQTSQREMLDGLRNEFNETLSETTSRLNEAFTQLDDAMQSEIESVVSTMAENLSGLAEKFVADYTPLLENSRKIVELSEKAANNG